MDSNTPNIIILFSDQHRADVLGCEGHPDVITPNLDKLAAEGARFERAYCQDAVCVPSRSSMITGLYCRTLGCLDNGDRSPVMDKVISLQKAFKTNGYRTAAYGKRHLFQACDEGWDLINGFGHEEGSPNYMEWIAEQGYGREFARDWAAEWGSSHPEGPKGTEEFGPAPLCAQPTLLPEDMTMEAFSRDQTIDFLKDRSEDNKPFFCFTSFYRPHQPYTPLPKYYESFDRSHWAKGRKAGDGIAKPPAFDENPEQLPPCLHDRMTKTHLPWNLKTAHEDQQIFRDTLAAYYAGVEEIDQCVGRIMDALDELGLRKNTIVIYTADHGEFAGGHGIMEKVACGHNVYEDCLRVPLIFNCPGKIIPGQVSTDLVELVDIYPTLMEFCSCRVPENNYKLPGISLVGHLTENHPVGRKYAISENWFQVSVIDDRYKLGIWIEPGKNPDADYRLFGNMLFDLQQDPYEINNLLNDPELDEIKNKLLKDYEEWQLKTPSPGKDFIIKNK